MARRRVVFNFAEASVGNGVTRTIGQVIAASGQNAVITEWEIYGLGVTASDPKANIQLARQSSAGTSNALTGVMEDSDDAGTIQTTARDTFTSTDPTITTSTYKSAMHPQGNYVWRGAQKMAPGERWGLVVKNNHAASSLTFGGHIIVEE